MPRGQPKKITPAYLEKAALFYLERYSSSAQNLRRVLDRKIRRSIEAHGAPAREEAAGWVTDLIAKLQRNKLLDDRAYAESRVRRLYAEGKSLGRIKQTLAVKGIGKEDTEAAMARLEAEATAPVSDLPAAAAFARKRKLGPYRDPALRAEMRQKDLGALARRGFSHAVAMKVLSADSVAALEEMVHDAE
ncbi:MAG: regulatory protein RecX [Ferrovibrio sp.]